MFYHQFEFLYLFIYLYHHNILIITIIDYIISCLIYAQLYNMDKYKVYLSHTLIRYLLYWFIIYIMFVNIIVIITIVLNTRHQINIKYRI